MRLRDPSRRSITAPVALQQSQIPSAATEPGASSIAAALQLAEALLYGVEQAVPLRQWVQTIRQDRRQNLVCSVKRTY